MGKGSGWADGSPPLGTDDIFGQRGGVNKRFPWKNLIRTQRKNFLINGAQHISQRRANGVIVGSPAINQVSYVTDHWFVLGTSTAIGAYWINNATAFQGFSTCLAAQRNAGDTNTGSVLFGTWVESLDAVELQGQTVTLSAYVAAGVNFSGTGIRMIVTQGTGTDESVSNGVVGVWTGSSNILDTTVALAAGATARISATFTVPATTKELLCMFMYTPSGTAGANDYVVATGMQLEPGPVMTDFEHVDYATDLARSMRYFEKSVPGPNGPCTFAGSINTPNITGLVGTSWFKVKKRTTPVMTYYDSAGTAGKITTWAAVAATNGVTPTSPSWNTTVMCDMLMHNSAVAGIQYDWAADAENY